MEWYCFDCNYLFDADPVIVQRTYTAADVPITVTGKYAYCPCCGSETINDDATDEILEQIHKQRYRRMAIRGE